MYDECIIVLDKAIKLKPAQKVLKNLKNLKKSANEEKKKLENEPKPKVKRERKV
jgi:hypothetical protein